MDSDAARAKLVAVQDDVIALGAHFPRRGLELLEVFVDDSGERVLRADPLLVGFAPLKEREASDPQKLPLRTIDRVQRVAEIQAQLAGYERGSFRAFDLLLGGDSDYEIAGLGRTGLCQLLDVVGANQLFDRGSRAFRR